MSEPAGATTSTDPSVPAGSRPRGRRWRFVVAGVLTALSAVTVLPDVLGRIDRFTPFAQVVAFRTALVGLLAAVVLLLAVGCVVRRRARRALWPTLVGLLVVAAVGAALVVPRAIPDPAADTAPQPAGRTLTVLAFNAYEGEADPAQLAALIRAERPDLVALSEAATPFRTKLEPLIADLGYRFAISVHPGRPDISGVTALSAPGLGPLTARPDYSTPFAHLELTGPGLGPLRFVAFHSVAPVRNSVPQWRADLGLLTRWCHQPEAPAIVAGDLNATLDSSVLRAAVPDCTDAASQRGAGLVGTWPSGAPEWLGPQIDHVLVTSGIRTEAFSVHPVDGSDHRAVVTRVHVPG